MRVILQAMADQPIFGVVAPIDLLAFQEGPQNAGEYADIEANFEAVFGGDFASTMTPADAAGCRTGFVYNQNRLQLLAATTLSAGLTHNIRRALFRPVDGTAADEFYIYSIHLNAGINDAASRAAEAAIIRSNADSLPSTAHLIYCGDFNVRGSNEGAYLNLFASGTNAAAVESLNTPFGFRANVNWNENLAFQPFHTQSTRSDMDDRFDAFYVNNRLLDGSGVEFRPGSLFALGNNGTHVMNSGINTGTGTMGFANELVGFSDHLPVCCQLDYRQSAVKLNSSVSIEAASNRTVRQSGPVGGASGNDFLNVEGTSNGTFASFGIVDFELAGVLDINESALSARDLILELRQNNFSFSGDGPVSVYLTTPTAADVPINASIQYLSGQNGLACVPAILSAGAIRVSTYAAVHRNGGSLLPNGTLDPMALFSPEFEAAVMSALNSGDNIRFLLTPDLAGTTATYAGFTNTLGGPVLLGDFLVEDGTAEIFPDSFQIVVGTQGSGAVSSTFSSDDVHLNFFSAPTTTPANPRIELQTIASAPAGPINNITLTIESNGNTANLNQKIEAFNFVTGQWESTSTTALTRIDQSIDIQYSGDISRFVGPGNLLFNRITIAPSGPTLFHPWRYSIDLFRWTIGQ